MPYTDALPSKAEIFDHWKDRFSEIGIFVDWGEPSCWACRFHYGMKYDVKSSDASWSKILHGWERIPLQRCHIVPRSLGGKDDPSNLFLMCRECHDLQPNTAFPEVFFEWARKQGSERREAAKIEEALRSFSIGSEKHAEIAGLLHSPDFKIWVSDKLGLHRPQSNYASISCRLTPATMVGLAVYYLRVEKFRCRDEAQTKL
jgi:HNH endonuclease